MRHGLTSSPSWSDPRRTTFRTAPRWPDTPPSSAATTATSATSSSAATRPWPTDRDVSTGDGEQWATAPPATTGTRRRWRPTSRWWLIPPAATTNASRDVKQPVFIRDNVYAAGAKAFEAEQGAIILTGSDVTATVVDEGAEVYLECHLPVAFDAIRVDTVSGADLERVRFVDADFEEPDGTPVVLAADLVGADKTPSGLLPGRPAHRPRPQEAHASACGRHSVAGPVDDADAAGPVVEHRTRWKAGCLCSPWWRRIRGRPATAGRSPATHIPAAVRPAHPHRSAVGRCRVDPDLRLLAGAGRLARYSTTSRRAAEELSWVVPGRRTPGRLRAPGASQSLMR